MVKLKDSVVNEYAYRRQINGHKGKTNMEDDMEMFKSKIWFILDFRYKRLK